MYKTCPCCDKKFYMPLGEIDFANYVYKYKGPISDNYIYYCGYTCWRKQTKDKKFRRSLN